MDSEKILNITTESGESEFQVRFLKNDGVGLLTTKTEKNYLILDSLDYWYDLIQTQYPKKKKCNCKNEWFKIQFEYVHRSETADFKQIVVYTNCTNCSKVSESLSIDIDYSPTDDLLKRPITYCDKPNIKYKFTELTSFWTEDNFKDFINYMFNGLNLNVYCWFFKQPENLRFFEKVNFDQAMQIITTHHYLYFFFSLPELDTNGLIEFYDQKGVYLRRDIWRKSEIIQILKLSILLDTFFSNFLSFNMVNHNIYLSCFCI